MLQPLRAAGTNLRADFREGTIRSWPLSEEWVLFEKMRLQCSHRGTEFTSTRAEQWSLLGAESLASYRWTARSTHAKLSLATVSRSTSPRRPRPACTFTTRSRIEMRENALASTVEGDELACCLPPCAVSRSTLRSTLLPSRRLADKCVESWVHFLRGQGSVVVVRVIGRCSTRP